MNAKLVSRLRNWKFDSALRYVGGEEDAEVVYALAESFGNSGWFDGSMGVIVGALVDLMTGGDDEPG